MRLSTNIYVKANKEEVRTRQPSGMSRPFFSLCGVNKSADIFRSYEIRARRKNSRKRFFFVFIRNPLLILPQAPNRCRGRIASYNIGIIVFLSSLFFIRLPPPQ